jgi:hypothetical protein
MTKPRIVLFAQKRTNLLIKNVGKASAFSTKLLCFLAVVCLLQPQCKCKLEEQLNNANTEPEFLDVVLEPCAYVDEVSAPCWETPSQISANVEIEVRTGSYIDNIFTPDPNPYDELDEDRDNMSCSLVNPNHTFRVKVPKTGAYALLISIRSKTCSYCCWGISTDIQCGNPPPVSVPGTSLQDYTAGRPKWAVEEYFVQGVNRPVALNGGNVATWTPKSDKYVVRKCTNCGCIVRR